MRLFILPLLLCGAACSGGAGGSAAPGDGRETLVPIVPVDTSGPTGSATYDGNIALRFISPQSGAARDLSGDLTLQIDFDNMGAAVAGSASGFTQGTAAYTGNLLVTTAALDDSSGGLDFNTTLTGALANDTSNYLVAGQMRGEVLGAGETAASGNIAGQVIERGTPRQLSGDFQAGRRP